MNILLHLREERKHYNQEKINLVQQLSEFEMLLSLPGFGRLTTALFIGGFIIKFSKNKKLNAYVGIRIFQLGQSIIKVLLIVEEIKKQESNYI